MRNNIQHKGIVDTVSDRIVKVRVTQMSACSSCLLSGRCHSSDGRDRIIEVPADHPDEYHVGDGVMVSADARVGHLAVLLGFGLPLVLLVCAVLLGRLVTGNDVIAALGGLTVLIPYFILLHLLRKKVQCLFSFRLRKVMSAEDSNSNKRIQESL